MGLCVVRCDMATEKSALLVKGLSDKHKDFLHRYAQDKLGTTSRTKAIIDLIEQQMMLEEENKSSLSEMQKVAVEEKKKYIEHHQNLIKQRQKDVQKATQEQNYDLLKKLSQSRISVEKKRIQFSLPIYDYQFLERLAIQSQSSIQYYIIAVLRSHLYGEKRLLGNEIEVLKKSNYELFKLGVNVNQIAKANNTGNMVELPIQQLYDFIQNHIKLVENILKDSIGIY